MKSVSLNYFYIFVGLLFVTLTPEKCKAGISCYECDWEENSNCGEFLDVNKIKMKSCPNSDACHFVETKYGSGQSAEYDFERGCGSAKEAEFTDDERIDCVEETDRTEDGTRVEYKVCTCNSSGCNKDSENLREFKDGSIKAKGKELFKKFKSLFSNAPRQLGNSLGFVSQVVISVVFFTANYWLML